MILRGEIHKCPCRKCAARDPERAAVQAAELASLRVAMGSGGLRWPCDGRACTATTAHPSGLCSACRPRSHRAPRARAAVAHA